MFKDIDGNLHERKEVSYHHVFPRSRAYNGYSRRFISQSGLLLPMLNETHNKGSDALHANVPLAPMPNGKLQHHINRFANTCYEDNAFDRFLAITGYINDLIDVTEDGGIARQCQRIAENIAQQAPFILLGQVEMVFVEKPE